MAPIFPIDVMAITDRRGDDVGEEPVRLRGGQDSQSSDQQCQEIRSTSPSLFAVVPPADLLAAEDFLIVRWTELELLWVARWFSIVDVEMEQ